MKTFTASLAVSLVLISAAALTVSAEEVPAAGTGSAAAAAGGTITVEVGIKGNDGTVRCALFLGADGFPKGLDKAKQRLVIKDLSGDKATCAFTGMPAGSYAVVALHDKNANEKMDTNMVGLPKEPIGFSNGAKIKMGPPSFDDAKFTHDGAATTQKIKTN